MMPNVLSFDHPDTAAAVAWVLETGRTFVFPTDTVYGIGGNPWDERTLNHVRRLKGRSTDQPFTLHLASMDLIERYAHYSQEVSRIIEALLPGPFTVLLPATAGSPPATVLHGKVGIRVPDHPFFRTTLTGPVFGTSVNAHEALPINDVAEIIEKFGSVDLIVTGEVSGIPSAILDLADRPYRLVRGTLTRQIRELLDQE